MNLNVNQINYRLIKEEKFTITLCKSGVMMMAFQCKQLVRKGKPGVAERFVRTLKLMIISLILII